MENPTTSGAQTRTGRGSVWDAAYPMGWSASQTGQVTIAEAHLKTYARSQITTSNSSQTNRLWSRAEGESYSRWRALSTTNAPGIGFVGGLSVAFEADLGRPLSSTSFLDYASIEILFEGFSAAPGGMPGGDPPSSPAISYHSTAYVNSGGLVNFSTQGTTYDTTTSQSNGTFTLTTVQTEIPGFGWNVRLYGTIPIDGIVGGFNAFGYRMTSLASVYGQVGQSVSDAMQSGTFSLSGPAGTDIGYSHSPIPEPSTLALLAFAGVLARRRARAARR